MKNKMYYYVMSYNEDYSIRTDIATLTIEDVNLLNDNNLDLLDALLIDVNKDNEKIKRENVTAVYTSDRVIDDYLFASKLIRIR